MDLYPDRKMVALIKKNQKSEPVLLEKQGTKTWNVT